ncbi:MAG: glycerol-3-phosphate 1-O-acyltransferase PlsY [Candidatus Methylomirabilis oxyfera]|nr:glycerol-3-phosphate 1-O-acyltransferase PlsY [Candidatus Methylomirabilis oxyfera]
MDVHLWLVPLGYLSGSVPFGLLIAKASMGVDVRRIGSGNIGATNVLRAAGKGAAALTLALDMLKGWAPVAFGRVLGASDAQVASVALAAFLGHLYPIFLGFRGGKGVATFLGVLLGLLPKVALLVAGVWVLVAAMFRYSSLAALIASAASPILIWFLDGRPLFAMLAGVLFSFIFIRHRENIRRLLAGEERCMGRKIQSPVADVPRSDKTAS